jgi:hypothetical protein
LLALAIDARREEFAAATALANDADVITWIVTPFVALANARASDRDSRSLTTPTLKRGFVTFCSSS